MQSRVKKARELFESGYNCSQSVFAAYSDLFDMDEKTALRVSAGMGGGVGRMREVCGAVSGAAMILGLKFGAVDADDAQQKQLCYEKVREMAAEFRKINPSIICRELLELPEDEGSARPEERNENYYKKRPCACLVEDAARALEKVLED